MYIMTVYFLNIFHIYSIKRGPITQSRMAVMRKILTYPFYDFKRKPEQSYLQKQNFSSIGRSPEK